MTPKLTTMELLTIILCLESAELIPTHIVKRAITAIHNVVTWSEVTEDQQLVRLKAFAPEAYAAYTAMLSTVSQVNHHRLKPSEAIKILHATLQLERVFTDPIYERMVSEIQNDIEMRQPALADNLSTLHEVGETLERIFNKS